MPPLLLLSPLLLLVSAAASSTPPIPLSSFSFPSFPGDTHSLSLLGDAHLSPPSAIAMSSGAILHRRPLPFGRMPSFSCRLSFSLPASSRLALLLSPDPSLPSSAFSVQLSPLDPPASSEKLRSWIDFDARRRLLELRVSGAAAAKPADPIIAYPIDLAGVIWREFMFVGLRSYGNSTDPVTVYDWSFEVRSAAPYRMHSVPLDPSVLGKPTDLAVVAGRRRRGAFHVFMAAATALLAAIVFFALLVLFGNAARLQVSPEECEKILAIAETELDGRRAEARV